MSHNPWLLSPTALLLCWNSLSELHYTSHAKELSTNSGGLRVLPCCSRVVESVDMEGLCLPLLPQPLLRHAKTSNDQQWNRSKPKNNRSKNNSSRRRQGRGGDTNDDESDEVDDDEDQEMEVATRHEELVYWYTGFEDPNCIAVVELVATVMDTENGVQVRPLIIDMRPLHGTYGS